MAEISTTAALTAQNTFCAATVLNGQFNVAIWGTFSATVTVQRSFDAGSTWLDVEQFTEAVQRIGFEPETNIQYRVGVKTGDYTSGTVNVRISQ